MNVDVDAFWVALWCEPWCGADPSWQAPDVAPQGWDRFSQISPAGRRLVYKLWCSHFGLDPSLPALPASAARAQLRGVAWDVEGLSRAALFIGMVAAVSASTFAGAWMRERDAVLASADIALWRRACALARARPLVVGPSARACADGVSAASLRRTGWLCLRFALEAIWPHAWQRLFFRCDAQLLRSVSELCPRNDVAGATDADIRHILRAWLGARANMTEDIASAATNAAAPRTQLEDREWH
ncbi:hypothetical protein J2W35_004174 [Variovorax boronicumulans]|uniref:hypothetical protein n=1 Tax=Variovorax boronicumulans TaxID=436515 RepID=UPI002786EB29|nr:hypothetical protein [Variovorax boronicumulans]MDQ0083808.1 hypothetical protein [Variovorax boronicumulans]